MDAYPLSMGHDRGSHWPPSLLVCPDSPDKCISLLSVEYSFSSSSILKMCIILSSLMSVYEIHLSHLMTKKGRTPLGEHEHLLRSLCLSEFTMFTSVHLFLGGIRFPLQNEVNKGEHYFLLNIKLLHRCSCLLQGGLPFFEKVIVMND